MNHIYKSIFNKALGVFTAVPEFASAHGKGSERTVVGRVAKGTAGFAASALAISVGLALTSTNAVAAGAPGIYVNNSNDPACMAFIDDIHVAPAQIIYGGSKQVILPDGFTPGTALSPDTGFNLAGRNPCVAVGGTAAENHDTQTNRTLFYNDKNLTLGGRLDVNSGIIGVGDRGVNGGSGATNSIRMGTGTTLDEANKHTNAIAIGVNTATTAEGAVAISAEAKARTSYSIAIGRNATAGGDMVPPSNETGGAIAIGRNSLSNYIGAIALGNGAEVSSAKPDGKTTDGIAIGTKALVDNYRGMAIGAQSQAKGSQSIVLANNAPDAKVSVASGIRSQVYGVESEASGTDAVAIGYKNTVAAHRTYAIGNEINVAKEAEEALAFGTRAHVSGAYQISLGSDAGADALAANTSGIAIGRNAGRYGQSGILNTAIGASSGQYISGSYNIAMGTGAGSGTDAEKLAASQTISIGHNAKASKHTAIAMGTTAQARTEKSVALGENAIAGDTAAPTVKKGEYSTAIGSNTTALGYGATAVGSITKAKVNYATALGHEAEASGSGETSLGYGAGANSTSPNGNRNGVNVGTNAGRYAISGGNNVAVGISAGQYVEGDNNIAQGYSAGYYIKGNENVSIGTNANVGSATEKLEVSKTVAIGSDAKTSANNAIAMGNTAQAKTRHSIAIGQDSSAGDDSANAEQKGVSAVAIGHGAKANYYDAIAIGARATVAPAAGNTTAADSIAIGVEATADNYKTTAIGTYARAKGRQSTVIANNVQGSNYSTASGDRSQVYGVETTVSGNNSVAIGDTNNVASARTYAMGNNINVAAGADDSLVFGTRAAVGAANAIALGNTAKATKENTIAQGTESVVYGKNSVSIGYKAVSGIETPTPTQTNAFSVSIGNETEAIDASTIAIGDKAKAKGGVDALAVGTQANAMTYKALAIGAYSQATGRQSTVIGNDIQGQPSIASGTRSQILGVQSNVSGDNSVSIGDTNTVASVRTYAMGNNISVSANASDSLALGSAVKVDGDSAIALGKNAAAAGNNQIAIGVNAARNTTGGANHSSVYSVAIGTNAGADNVSTAQDGNTEGVAIGYNAGRHVGTGIHNSAIGLNSGMYIQGSDNIAFGSNAGSGQKDAVLDINRTVAIGANALSSKNNAVSIGGNSKAQDISSVAIGDTATAANANSVALGARSTTSDVHTGAYTLNNSYTAAGLPNAANGTVSVGAAGKERQIQNVAAGVISATSTDAINGSQLYATNNYMSNFATGVKNVLGGDAAVDNAGNLTMSNIGGTGKGNVNDAIAAANTKVAAGDNITVTPTDNADGSKTYTVATKKDLVVDSVKAGDTTVNTDGVTITGGPSVKKDGINAGDKVISGVADGNVAAGSKDAVNGGQLAEVKAKADSAVQDVKSGDENALTAVKDPNTNIVTVTPKLSGDLVDTNGNITAPTTPAEKGKLVTAGTVAEALANTHFVVDTKATDGELDAASQADQKIKASNKVTLQAGKNLKAKQTNGANGAEVEFSLKDSISLKEVKVGEGSANEVVLNNNGVNVAGNTYINKDGLNANDKKITNVAPGAVTAASKDAVNGSQLYNVANNVKDLIGPDAAIDPATGKVTVADPAKGIGETGKGNIGDAIKHVNDAAKAAAETAAKHTTVVEGKNVKVTKGKNAAGGDEYTVATKDDLDVTSVTAGNTTVNTNGLTITGGPSVTRGGIDAGNRVISGVKAGDVSATSQEAVNGSQLHATNTKLDGVKAKADTAVQDVKSGDENALTAVKDPNTNIVTVTPKLSGDLVDANGNITAPTTPADKGKLVTAGTVADALANTHFVVDTKATDGELDAASQADQKIKAGNKVTLQAGKNLKAKQTNGANGAQVEFSLKDSISLKEVTAGEGANQVVLNDKGVNVGGNTYINNDGLNANGNKITNVADGVDPTDAVNKGQLDAVKGVADSAVKSVDVANGEQNLVVDNSDPKNPKLSLKKDLTVDSVKAGDSTLNTDGLTIAGGPSVKKDGINAGDKTITNVAPGAVTPTSKDAVNGGQLYNVANNVKDLIGPDATIDPATGKVTVADPAKGIAGTGKGTIGEAIKSVKDKADTAVQDIKSGDEKALSVTKAGNTYTITPNLSGDLVDADGNITAPATDADKGKLVTAGTVAQALANTHFVVDTKATDGELDAASQADQKIKAGNKVTLQAGKNLKAKQTNGANGAQVEFSLKDSISLKEVTAGEGANQVVLNDKGVNVGGNTYINNDGLNANGNKITNVADGVDPTDAVNKGQLDAVKGVADSAVKSVDVANGEQNLVVDNSDPKNPKLSLKKDLTVDSVKAGDSTLNTDGLTIAGGPSVKKDGINAGDKTITNVAPGAVTAASKDAVNGSQLYNVADNVKDLIGPDATIDPATGKVTVADPAKGIGETGKGNIGDAIKHVNDAAKAAADTAKKHTTVEQGDNIVVEESLNADGGKHYKVSTAKDLNVDSVKAGDTTVNNDGVTIAGGPSVTKGGINAGGNTITNVADGVNPNDAVNKGQLDAVKGVADSAVKSVDVANGEQNLVVDNSDPKNPKLSLKKDLTVDSVKAGDSTLNTDGLTIAGGPSVKKDGINAGDKTITNVAPGAVTAASKDAVNGSQLYNVADNVKDLIGPDATIDPATGKVTVADPAKGIGETGKGNIGDAIKHVNDAAKAAADTAKKHTTVEQGDNIVVEESLNADGGKHYKVSTAKDLNVDSVKAGDTTVNNDGVTIAGGPSVTKGGINAGGNTITNVADGVNPNDAVNKGQLDKVDTKVSNVAQNVVNVLGGNATVNGNGDITMSNIGDTGKGNVNDAIKAVNDLAKKAAAEKTSVKAKDGRSNVTVTEGVNAAGGHEYTVDVERSVTNAGSDYVTVTNNHDADSNTTTYTVDVSAKTKASLAKADSAVQGLTSKDGNLNFTKGANGNVEVSFNDNLNVKNVTTDRVQVANGPSMSKDGINAAGKAISNVANGNVAADSKDAVNGGQLHETAQSVADVIGGGATVKDGKVVAGQNGIGNTGQNTVHGAIAAINQNTANNFNQIRGDLRKMDRDLRGGIAGALATAGLPQAFRPGKSMVAAAASTYRGQSGLAIGVSRISDNGKVILKVTGNTNSRGDFGGTIGAGYQW